MIGIGSNKKIIDIYNEIKGGTLKLQPGFQRKLVWNPKHKESFIETILSELPFPEVYTAIGEIDLKTQTTEVLVVDGQQRLSTIYEYIMGADTLKYENIKRFTDLSPDEQTKFFYYVVVVRDLGHIPIKKIKDIFKRINSVDYALEAMEINNALYDGEYINTAKSILEKLKLYSAIKENEIMRMKDLEFVLAIMVTNDLEAYFPGYKEIEGYVDRYNDLYEDKDKTLKNFDMIIALLNKINLKEDSIWINSKSCYFTLLVELLKVIDKISIEKHAEIVAQKLEELEQHIMKNKDFKKEDSNKYSIFYKAMYQGTSSKKNRRIRGALLEQELKSFL
ncbi:DUF262 domain-containing protein [Lutibacter sp. B2]|nr:DUF262 domain-containing protein [Lutibacter sp. B2]